MSATLTSPPDPLSDPRFHPIVRDSRAAFREGRKAREFYAQVGYVSNCPGRGVRQVTKADLDSAESHAQQEVLAMRKAKRATSAPPKPVSRY